MTSLSKFQALLETIGPRLDDETRMSASVSFFNAPHSERKRRMQWVLRFATELQRVRSVSLFGTGTMESDLHEVIEGRFWRLRENLAFYDYAEESEDLRLKYAPLHAAWKKLLEEYILETKASLFGLGEA